MYEYCPSPQQRAIANIELHYPVVGILERLDDTLLVMEKMMPKGVREMFKDYYKRFRGGKHGERELYSYSNSTKGLEIIAPSPHTQAIVMTGRKIHEGERTS